MCIERIVPTQNALLIQSTDVDGVSGQVAAVHGLTGAFGEILLFLLKRSNTLEDEKARIRDLANMLDNFDEIAVDTIKAHL